MSDYDYPYEKPGARDEREYAAQQKTIPGPTYPNPNEAEEYVPPEVEPATESDDDLAEVPNDVPDGRGGTE